VAFFEHQLSDRIARGSKGGPVWSTERVKLRSGRQQKNRAWTMPLHRYDISFGIKTIDDFELVRALHYNVGGSADGFRMKDWSDYRADQDTSSLTNITGNSWQLQRAYIIGARTFLRDIYKPCSTPAPVVWRTRAGVPSAISPAIDTTTGIATITGHQAGDTYTWVGEFDVPVAFADDAMDQIVLDGVAGSELYGLPSILLEEIRIN
jgi:uncharacterized protein (TIGR02217 family)